MGTGSADRTQQRTLLSLICPCARLRRMPAEENTHSIHGRIVRISSEPKTAPRGGYLFRGLEMSAELENERLFLILPVFAGRDLYDFPLLCWEGARVSAFDVQLNNRLEDGSVIYAATPDCCLLLEPHRPISVTEAVEAAHCIKSADVRFRVGPDEPFWMAKGKLIHTLFDHVVRHGSDSGDDGFRKAYRKALPSLLEVLPGSGISTPDRVLEEDARTHFRNLREWLESNGHRSAAVELECDRISTRWGLKGRADAIFHQPAGRTIVELKSGKTVVEGHLLQLYAYSLLFALEMEDGLPEGSVFYSATGRTEQLRISGDRMKRAIIEGRNRVVSLKHSYTEPAGAHEPTCDHDGKCFSRRHCFALFGSPRKSPSFLTGVEREYYDRWFRLLSVDDWIQETDFARILDPITLQERIEEGTTLAGVKIIWPEGLHDTKDRPCVGADPDSIQDDTEDVSAPKDTERFTEAVNSPVQLVLPDTTIDLGPGEDLILHRGSPCTEEALRGRVIGSVDGRPAVSVNLPFPRSADAVRSVPQSLHESNDWYVDRIPFSRGREVARRALFTFFSKADPNVVETVIRGHAQDPTTLPCSHEGCTPVTESRPPASVSPPEDLCFSEGLDRELNEDQERAVGAALEADTYHLIHGPPGTGKTRVLARFIRICLDRGKRVLVVCPTNVALDRVLLSLMDLGVRDLLRVGGRNNVSRDFLDTLKRRDNPPILLRDLADHGLGFASFKERVGGTRLVGATAYQVSAHPLFLRQRFDLVVVDEAGQLDEPSTLGPLALAPKFVLGGDHLQLPPVVQARQGEFGIGTDPGLEQSLFERLVVSADKRSISSLGVQYRMNREVQEIPSRLFYDGGLTPSPDAAGRRLNIDPGVSDDPLVSRIIDPALPVVFVDVPGAEGGKARPEEALVVCRILESLHTCGVPPAEVGVITPYRAQQALIRKLLARRRPDMPHLSVDTVDRFQGGEREVIIVSLARSDGVTSFLADRKRLNVSLSRARSKLILIGHGTVLEEHPLFRSVLEGIERVQVGPDQFREWT